MEGLENAQQQMAMTRELIIREGIIFLEEEVPFHPSLSLKLCHHRQIYKFHDFQWNSVCRRWERASVMRLPWPSVQEIGLQVFVQEGISPVVIGEGSLTLTTLIASLSRQIRISLTYDGAYVGCLYCVVSDQVEEDLSKSKHFLYLHKLEIGLLEEIPHQFTLNILRNGEKVYQKGFHLHQKAKTLFPNIKLPMKLSDMLTVELQHPSYKIRLIKFVADSIRRGKTSTYEVWLRNSIKNRVGDLKIEYFLQNYYLQNQRQIFTRKGIFLENILQPTLPPNQPEKTRLRRSVILRQIEEADQRILKIDKNMRRLIRDIEAKEAKHPKSTPLYQLPSNGSTQNENSPWTNKKKRQNRSSLQYQHFQ